MRLQVDYTRCTGLGVCESIAPAVFGINEDGSMEVHDESPAEALRPAIEEAVSSCPTEAISILG